MLVVVVCEASIATPQTSAKVQLTNLETDETDPNLEALKWMIKDWYENLKEFRQQVLNSDLKVQNKIRTRLINF